MKTMATGFGTSSRATWPPPALRKEKGGAISPTFGIAASLFIITHVLSEAKHAQAVAAFSYQPSEAATAWVG